MTVKLSENLKPKKNKVVKKEVKAVAGDAPVHLPDGEFIVGRADGDAPVSTLTVSDLHPVAMDEAMEKHGEPAEWVVPYPSKGLVRVAFTVQTPIAGKWYSAGEVVTIPAELAHSIHKQITQAPEVDHG